MPKTEAGASSMRSLDRAIDVLEVLEAAPRGLRLSEIARAVELPLPTTLRILAALENRNRVERDESIYRAGPSLLFGAHAYLNGSPLVLASRAVLQDLALETGLTSSVFLRSGNERVIIARTEGRNPLRYELPIGERLPLHLGAGKALVAHLPADERNAWIMSVTPFTTVVGREVGADEYRADLDQARARGFAEATEERVRGGRSIAAPVFGRDERVIAAVQVASTLAAIPDEAVGATASAVCAAAEALRRRI